MGTSLSRIGTVLFAPHSSSFTMGSGQMSRRNGIGDIKMKADAVFFKCLTSPRQGLALSRYSVKPVLLVTQNENCLWYITYPGAFWEEPTMAKLSPEAKLSLSHRGLIPSLVSHIDHSGHSFAILAPC